MGLPGKLPVTFVATIVFPSCREQRHGLSGLSAYLGVCFLGLRALVDLRWEQVETHVNSYAICRNTDGSTARGLMLSCGGPRQAALRSIQS
jgi:hypothetical protein